MNRFFTPFVGLKYNEGICEKKVLVIGASFYCNKTDCKYFKECTNPLKKDSSMFDKECPCPENEEKQLRFYPKAAINEGYKAYGNFARFIQRFSGQEDYYSTWSRMAYTNYLQFFSPTIQTKKEYLSDRDFEAFKETIIELKPDVVFVWGVVTIQEIRDNEILNPYIYDRDKLKETEYYVCHMRIPEVGHEIALINCYHPSSPIWYSDLEKLTKYTKQVLEN